MRAAVFALTLLAGLGAPTPGTAQPAGEDEAPADRFLFRSDPLVGLHHLLIAWAAAEAGEWPPFAPPIAERGAWRSQVDDEEARIWAEAVEAYDASRGRSLLFDDGLLAVRAWAAGTGSREAVPEGDRPLLDALKAALPVYRQHWWPSHDRRNRAWIEAVASEVDRSEEDVVPRLAAAYGGDWPDHLIPVDVVVYANPVGAYSTRGRVTISSVDRDNGMPQAVELVFHEASHMESLEGPLRDGVRKAFSAAGGEAPDRFWHDVIFYTTGEVVRIVLEARGEPGYRHYGEASGLYARGQRWRVELPALEDHWRSFLRSSELEDGARRAALAAVAGSLLAGR